MGSLARFDLAALARDFRCAAVVETGTGSGAGILHAARAAAWQRLFTIELFPEVAEKARAVLAAEPRVTLLEGTSEEVLRRLLPALPADEPVLFWLDAHFPGADFGYASYDSERDEALRLPLERELRAIRELRPQARDVILIDDLRIYEDGPFASGIMPDFAQTLVPERRHIRFVAELFGETHRIHRLYQEEGYVVLLPRDGGGDGDGRVEPYVLAGNGTPSIGAPRTMHECGKAALRRLHQASFVSRYFVGRGLDVGAGSDPLSAYAELFPRIAEMVDWDWEQGDAQRLAGVPDESFDFVHSSHCLEHLADPAEGLANWLRVLKPGGHLVVTVPDEDLYEQGVFPSRYNGDHKWTFTIHKQRSWSERSLNLLDLLRALGPAAEVQRVELLDASYRYGLPAQDQTLTAVGECAIEFVVRKRPAAEIEAGGRLPAADGAQAPAPQTLAAERAAMAEQVRHLSEQVEALARQRDALLDSTSWKLTGPVRWVRRLLSP